MHQLIINADFGSFLLLEEKEVSIPLRLARVSCIRISGVTIQCILAVQVIYIARNWQNRYFYLIIGLTPSTPYTSAFSS